MQPTHDEIVAITRQLSSRVWRFEDRDFKIDKFGIGTDCVLSVEFLGGNAPGWTLTIRSEQCSEHKAARTMTGVVRNDQYPPPVCPYPWLSAKPGTASSNSSRQTVVVGCPVNLDLAMSMCVSCRYRLSRKLSMQDSGKETWTETVWVCEREKKEVLLLEQSVWMEQGTKGPPREGAARC
jgi:hypothetical protein